MDVLDKVSGYFKRKDVEIDTNVCKLHYRLSAAIFLSCSLLGMATKYFGEPISCNFQDTAIDSSLANEFCWIHGSNHFSDAYKRHVRCVADPGGREGEAAKDTSYYQWVTLVLFLQAIASIVPYKFWKLGEGGIIKSFKSPGRILQAGDESFKSYAKNSAEHFLRLSGKYREYFIKFVIVEITFLVLAWAQFFFTDWFLNGNFLDYGVKASQYYGLSLADKEIYANPLCTAFPTEVSCTIPYVGDSGKPANANSMCVLSQNIVHEKIYVLLWFWCVFLMIMSTFSVVFRAIFIFVPSYRAEFIRQRVGNGYYRDEINNLVRNKFNLGDCFVINQLGKNMDSTLFEDFLDCVIGKLNHRYEEEEGKNLCTTPC